MKEKSALRYMRIVGELAERIAGLGPNTLLPTENELSNEFGVSRVTVRQALRVLEQAGSVTRARGRGTIVSPPKFTRNVIPVITLEEDLKRQGIAYETLVLEFQRNHSPPEVIRERLKLRSRSSVGKLNLVRRVNGQIICFERRYCIPGLARQIALERIVDCAIVTILSQLVGSNIQMVEFESEITPSCEEVAFALGITASTLILQNTFVYFLDDGTPVETGSISYRVDRCKFRAIGRLPAAVAEQMPEQQSVSGSSPDGSFGSDAPSLLASGRPRDLVRRTSGPAQSKWERH